MTSSSQPIHGLANWSTSSLTRWQQQALLETPAGFAWLASRERWKPQPHLSLLSQTMMRLESREITRLIVMEPPRHGKSQQISEYGPPWYLRKHPDHRVILTSYAAGFAESWGRKARDIFEQRQGLLRGLRLRDDSSAAARWDLLGHRGGMETGGVGGPLTGKGADWLIIDDPVKNAEEANSEAYRAKQWEWLHSVALSRLEPGGVAILVMTRWHEDDMAGRLIEAMKHGGERWTVIRLPAIAEEDEAQGPFSRKKGEALWPGRYDLETLRTIEKRSGPYWWAALYQQRPQPLGGSIFKRDWFRYYRDQPEFYELLTAAGPKLVAKRMCQRFATVDLAASTRDTADYFVIASWAVTPDNDLLRIGLLRTRLEGPDQVPALRTAYERYGLSVIAIESTSYQLTMVQAAAREGLPVEKLNPDTDKVSRALTAGARLSAGTVYWPVDDPDNDAWERELLAFPHGKHDDQVDVLSYAADRVAKGVGRPRVRRL